MNQIEKATKTSGMVFGAGLLAVVIIILFVAAFSVLFHAVGDVAREVDQSGGMKAVVDRVWNGAPEASK